MRQKKTTAEHTTSYSTAEERTALMGKINSYNEGQSPAHQIKLVSNCVLLINVCSSLYILSVIM